MKAQLSMDMHVSLNRNLLKDLLSVAPKQRSQKRDSQGKRKTCTSVDVGFSGNHGV